ncbi:MAG TPA: hypothetical protein VNJ02_16395 [Vicinamibacterales bacterium]|nr:hypothetical protein [Vicinamibacterales bacterium]
MFACLYSLSAPIASLVKLAEDFTPRFEVVESMVMMDVGGLSRLFGSPQDIGEHMRRAGSGPIRIALAPTQTAAALLALGRPGLTVVMPGEQPERLASLPVTLLGDFDRLRLTGARPSTVAAPPPAVQPPSVSEMSDVLPYFNSCLDRTTQTVVAAHCGGGGWMHPRDSHAANHSRRTRREPEAARDTVHANVGAALSTQHAAPGTSSAHSTEHQAPSTSAVRGTAIALKEVQSLQDTLRRWGITTFGALAMLSPGDVYQRLGARGVLWQRLARGEDSTPLVPWIPEDPFEGALDLEWPIEGLEPLSFVLGRLLEPLAERLERADRGAAILHTHLRLVNKQVHARTLQLPTPMRDPKTLRTLILLDLESNPPAAAIDHVRVLAEPTPARVTQWMLFERAQPSPEHVSTLVARLSALMGETHVGSPRLVDSWKLGAFEMAAFEVRSAECKGLSAAGAPSPALSTPALSTPALSTQDSALSTSASALRRFRLPVPARVQVQEGRPVRVMTDRRGVNGGPVVQAAGPWRTSGEWWNDAEPGQPWDRDEWDVAIGDGTVYRIYVERDIGQWFLEGVVD